VGAQLYDDALEVGFYCFWRDPELGGNRFVRSAFANQRDNRKFSL
jgi:hypothetical protein